MATINVNPGRNPLEGKNLSRYVIFGFIIFLLFMLLSNTTFITIPPGHKGVKFKRFAGGINKEKIYEQGFHVVMPWDNMIVYDIRINEAFEKMDVLSKNGLSIAVDLSYRFQPKSEKIGYLHDGIGADYAARIIAPEIRICYS